MQRVHGIQAALSKACSLFPASSLLGSIFNPETWAHFHPTERRYIPEDRAPPPLSLYIYMYTYMNGNL
jgi:hypothetical protein